ncbi:MAG: hypothetical protein IPO27_09900 [Bacteroidetes bacterium]|nr:hypothetical protein [Bacteroidota bacterium]
MKKVILVTHLLLGVILYDAIGQQVTGRVLIAQQKKHCPEHLLQSLAS